MIYFIMLSLMAALVTSVESLPGLSFMVESACASLLNISNLRHGK
uniref:NADH dehydrogenase subunit 4L n=2 Tax=Picea TaxID=3328 RepID=A0A101M530_PICGL|nr:hypothetical protein ABT39_MTgene979 [Picea glauca]QHR92877.1 hypothetical protein Q903MT_gene6925 [Picea sitchensis]